MPRLSLGRDLAAVSRTGAAPRRRPPGPGCVRFGKGAGAAAPANSPDPRAAEVFWREGVEESRRSTSCLSCRSFSAKNIEHFRLNDNRRIIGLVATKAGC